ncbi:MAG: GWxTD domain-containing protein, partial [Bacteroidota bacterium]
AFIGEDTLQFYWEVYDADELIGEPFFTEIQLLAASTRKAVAGHRMMLKPEAPTAFSARTIDMDISDLPSQTYLLDVQFKTNAGVRKGGFQQKFFVYNPKAKTLSSNEQAMFDVVYGYTEAQLDSFIPTMTYLMNEQQKLVAKGLENYDQKKAFFYNFWARLKAKPDNPPGLEWQNYYQAVKYANQNFESQLREGWRTDRGRVMLEYGPPSNVQTFYDPRNYIIWEYDNLNGQSGVIFIFNATERSTNEYWLVHSTLRGEIFNAAVANELQNMLEGDSPYLEQTPMIVPSTTGATRHRD